MLQTIYRVEIIDADGNLENASVFFATLEKAREYANIMYSKNFYIKKYWLKLE